MIRRIYIARAGASYDSDDLEVVPSGGKPVVLKGADPVEVSVVGATVSMSADDPGGDLFAQALATILSDGLVASVNGVRPDLDGQLWLWPDKCFGWRPLTPGEAKEISGDQELPAWVHTYVKRYPAEGGGSYTLYNDEQFGGGIALTNNCVSCGTCASLLGLYRQIEWLKMAFNSLKDSSLYDKDTCDDRLEYLSDRRLSVPENCEVPDDSYADPLELPVPPGSDGVRLMGQYVTMVHMWNYAVAQNNSFTEIHSTPEDPAGFYVQTKKSLPSCDTSVLIDATIRVTLNSGQQSLSIFVPEPKTSFKPFHAGDPAWESSATVTNDATPTTKTVTTTFSSGVRAYGSGAGTYLLTAKFLPFKITKLMYGSQQFAPSQFDWNNFSTGAGAPVEVVWTADAGEPGSTTPVGSSAIVPTTAVGYVSATVAPTVNTSFATSYAAASDYNDAKTYPSRSVPGMRNMWQIVVSWTVTWPGVDGAQATVKTWQDTYMFETNAVREYVDRILNPIEIGAIENGSVVPVSSSS